MNILEIEKSLRQDVSQYITNQPSGYFCTLTTVKTYTNLDEDEFRVHKWRGIYPAIYDQTLFDGITTLLKIEYPDYVLEWGNKEHHALVVKHYTKSNEFIKTKQEYRKNSKKPNPTYLIPKESKLRSQIGSYIDWDKVRIDIEEVLTSQSIGFEFIGLENSTLTWRLDDYKKKRYEYMHLSEQIQNHCFGLSVRLINETLVVRANSF